MPAKPVWYSKLPDIIQQLTVLPRPFVDRSTVEFLLGVGRRRAQQIMAPCVSDRVGANGLVDRDALIAHLRALAEGDDAFYEVERRRKVANVLQDVRQNRLERPQLLVEAPASVINQDLGDLPPGIAIDPGRITIQFEKPRQALEKLLALAMAIGNDYDSFEQRAAAVPSTAAAPRTAVPRP